MEMIVIVLLGSRMRVLVCYHCSNACFCVIVGMCCLPGRNVSSSRNNVIRTKRERDTTQQQQQQVQVQVEVLSTWPRCFLRRVH